MGLFLWLVPAVLATCILGGVIPQGEEASPLVRLLGLNAVFSRWWFAALLGLLGLNLGVCSLQRLWTLRRPVWVTHLGMLVILAGGLATGLASRHGTLRLEPGRTATEAAARDGGALVLPFGVRLVKFTIEKYGADRHVLVSAESPGRPEILLDERRAAAIAPGTTARLVRAYPDFVVGAGGPATRSAEPRNPAAQMEVTRGGKRSRVWLFERFPSYAHAHGGAFGLPDLLYRFEPAAVRQYRSEVDVVEDGKVVASRVVQVNTPLHWKGWTLYQSAYDPNDARVAVLQVARDPGTPVVYLGFLLLPVGLLLTALDGRTR